MIKIMFWGSYYGNEPPFLERNTKNYYFIDTRCSQMKKTICLLLCLIMICASFIIPAAALTEQPQASSLTLENFDGKRIGILTGSIHENYANKVFPHSELQYYSAVSDLTAALQSGAIDAFLSDTLTAYTLLAENGRIAIVDPPLDVLDTAFAFAKTPEGGRLRDEMNVFLQAREADGSRAELREKWLVRQAADYGLDMSGLTGNEKTVVFATACSGKPISYYYNGVPTGYEVELAAMFCREYGYNLDIQVTDFSGIIPGLASGKYDFGADAIAVTPEREQSVNFSVPDINGAVVLITLNEEQNRIQNVATIADLNRPDAKLGMVTGTIMETHYKTYVPNAQIKYYNTFADLIYALSVRQIDGFLEDEIICRYSIANVPGLTYINEPVGETLDAAYVVGDTEFDQLLLEQLNEFLVRSKADGTLDKLIESWIRKETSDHSISIPTDGANGIVKAAVCAECAPSCYMQNNELAGYEIEILARFCTEYGYGLSLTDMDFGALLNSVKAGRHDVACGNISITEERKEAVNFSEPYISTSLRMMVHTQAEETNFWSNLVQSFERTFIKEQRWKLIVQGIEVTVFISVCSAILGTVLGFGLCLLRRKKNRIVQAITAAYIRILQGTPILVLLMILFYIVFAKSGISGELVAIIAFAMNFAAYVCEMFRTGIDSVDPGQTEAGLALGYTKRQTFYRIVMPQAAMHFLPVYKGEFISLVKMTSVVGYIAVQDLTKMSDIIRARTYEPFFPLIATALIYFLLASLLTLLLKVIEIKISPSRTNRTVKGVVNQ